jgi:uncharacterized OsmC-like protein
MATPGDIRQYEARGRSTDTFGRVLCGSRNHHFVVDGPVQNGCPGEEITPAELFLNSVAACGVELVQVIARNQELPLQTISASISALQDRGNPARPDFSVFNSVRMQFHMSGVSEEQANQLVDAFKRR